MDTQRPPAYATGSSTALIVTTTSLATPLLDTAATPSETCAQRPSTWGAVACGSFGGLAGGGMGFSIAGTVWGLLGGAACLPGLFCGYRLFKPFDASASAAQPSKCIGFAPKHRG